MASPCVITYNGKDYTLDEFMKSVSQGEIAVGKEEENVVEKQLIDEVEGQIKQLKNDFFNEKITTSEYNKKLYPLEDKLAALKKGTPKETAPKEEPIAPESATGATATMPAGTQTQEVTKPLETVSNDKENIQGLPSEERIGQEPIATQPEQAGGRETPKASGVLQAQEQEEVDTDKHPKYDEALKVVQSTGHASVPLIQRRLNTTYTQAQEIFRQLERDGHVLKSDENSNVYDVVTPEVVEEKQPSPDALKDVESTAKALEGVDISNIEDKVDGIVYHGTSYDIEKPTIEKYGQVHEMGGMLGKAVYYTPSKSEAKYFADLSLNKNKSGVKKIISGVLKAKNIISVSDLVKQVSDDVLNKWIKDSNKYQGSAADLKKRADIESSEKSLTSYLSRFGDISELARMNGNDAVTWGYEGRGVNEIAIVDDSLIETNKQRIIAEAYHAAKADGSNPELVKAVEELLGGKQEQQSSPQPVKDETTPEQAKKRLDDDLEILKSIKDKKTAEQKFIGTIERAWLAKEQGKITKPEYTEFKKKAQQVLEGKIRAQDEAKATEAKLAVSKAMAKVKDRLVGKGHSPMALSAPIPVTPRTVADLIDLATSLANKAIDAGMEIKLAFAKAKRVVATHPTYMKLAKSGLLNEANFMTELDKAEYEVSKSLEELNPEPEAKQEPASIGQPSEISGPWKPKKTGERLKASPKMKEVIKEMTEDDMMYLSIDMNKASEYVDNVLNQFQSEDKLTELAEEILAGNSPFPEKIKNVANARLADRLRVMSENINDTFQKRTLIQKAGKLWSERMKSINISATQVALERLVAKELPLSTEGIKEMYQSAFQNTQEIAMGKENVEAVKDAYNSVQEALQTEEGAKTLREAVMSELERVAEALAGKEWLDKFNAARKKIKKDLSDC